MSRLSLLFLVSLAACHSGEDQATKKWLGAREDSRRLLNSACGECHIKTLPTAIPGALAVFDLTETDWAARMSEAQLRNAAWRLSEPIVPTTRKEGARPLNVSAEDRALFDSFISLELEMRRRKVATRSQ